MTSDDLYNDPILPAAEEREALAALQAFLESDHGDGLALLGSDGERETLPATVVRALRWITAEFAEDRAIELYSLPKILTFHDAARLLGFTWVHLESILDEGRIPSSGDGMHRRIALEDVLAFKRAFKQRQREGLKEIVRLSEEMGLYELEQTP